MLCDGLVEEAEVVVTANQPLGVWQLQGVPLAPIVRAAQAGEGLDAVLAGLEHHQRLQVMRWLREQRIT